MTAQTITRQTPRPKPGQMPEPRTPYAVWVSWGDQYTLRRGHLALVTIALEGGRVRTEGTDLTVTESMLVNADVAALTHWFSRGGR